jgi:integrase
LADQDSIIKDKPNHVKFAADRVRKFKCPEGKREAFLWDTRTPGLGIRAFASGKKSYIFQTWVNGRTRRSVIGDFDSFDLDKAQEEAKKFDVFASQNISPDKVKRQRAAAESADEIEHKRGLVTFGIVWLEYVEANRNGWGNKHHHDHLVALQAPGLPWARGKGLVTKAGCLWPLVEVKLGELTPSLIERWLEKENKTRPGVAAQSYRLLFACLNWCAEQDQYIGLIDLARLKSKAVKKTVVKMKPRDDVLQREQLPALFNELRKIQNPVINAYAQTLLLTGARRNELTGLQWSDVDFQWKSMTIRDKATSKGQVDGVRVIPLTPYVASLINLLPRRNQWVFSSPTGKNGRLVDTRKSYGPAIVAAGLEGLTLHGLRRSFSTLSEWVEVPAGVIAQLMGHKPSATAEKHYKQRPLDLLRMWHERIEAWILEQAGIEQPKQMEKSIELVISNG